MLIYIMVAELFFWKEFNQIILLANADCDFNLQPPSYVHVNRSKFLRKAHK